MNSLNNIKKDKVSIFSFLVWFRQLKLRNKFFIYFSGLVIMVIILISVAIFYFQKEMLRKLAADKAIDMTYTFAHIGKAAILDNDYILLQTLIESMQINNDILSIAILDTTGTVLVADQPELRGQNLNDPVNQLALLTGTIQPKNTVIDGQEIWDTAVPIPHFDKMIATVRIKYSVEDTYAGLIRSIILIGIIVFGVSLVLAYKISRSISKPINAAVDLAEAYGKGNFELRIKKYPGDEIGQLIDSLNKLSQQLKILINEKIANEGLIMIGEFASYIIHDLKNPLNGIHLLADGLHRKVPEDSPLRKYTTEMLLAAQKVEDFIKRTLDIAKSTQLNIQPIQINDLIEDTVQEVHFTATPVSKRLDPTMPHIPGDYVMLLMAFKNLLTNAADAIVGYGRITIETQWKDQAIIKISDTGTGIAKEKLSTIFRPFFSEKDKGHGLGLAMVKRVVILHKGEIQVESEVGVGSTFIITLPGGNGA